MNSLDTVIVLILSLACFVFGVVLSTTVWITIWAYTSDRRQASQSASARQHEAELAFRRKLKIAIDDAIDEAFRPSKGAPP